MKSVVLGSVLGATLLLLNGCGSDDAPTETIADLANGDTDLSTLVTALKTAELLSVFNNSTNEFTVFAPTNEAFSDVQNLTCLLGSVNGVVLDNLLKYHVHSGTSLAKDLSNDTTLTTLDGDKILNVTNDGKNVTLNNKSVTQGSILATNGVVHVIDKVLIPDDYTLQRCSEGDKDPLSILDLGKSIPSFSTLISAMEDADLADVFNGTGRDIFTVFAPTNDAFTTAFKDKGCTLESATSAELVALLKHHVVGSYALSSSLTNDEKLPALDGEKLTVSVTAKGVKIDDVANVTSADNYATNGVVHQIDAVLVPVNWECTGPSSGPWVMV